VEPANLEAAVLERVAAGTLRVPPYPAVAVRVQEALGRRETGLAEVAQLVGADAALTAAILRCANSALYRRGPPVAELLAAVTRIGANEVMRLLLASGLSGPAYVVGPLAVLRRVIWIEGLASAALCQELARLRGLRTEEAFVLGLLHDFGQVVATAALEAILEERRLEPRWPPATWEGMLDRLHVPVGRATAERWRLPPLVGEVIAAHHPPDGSAGRTCRDPRLLEVVRASDAVVRLMLGATHLGPAELAAVPGLSAGERAALARVVEGVPEFVAAFETPAANAFVASPRVEQPETTLDGERRPSRFGVSIAVARRPRLFTAVEVHRDGLVLEGDEPLPEKRLLEAKIYAPEPFAAWVLTRLCRRTGQGFRVEIQPFAMSEEQRELWGKLAG
jgi:HD-like signal output (HDOD) protein